MNSLVTTDSLKKELKGLDFNNPETIIHKDLDTLIEHMVDYIGSTDPELRDKLIYTTFYYVINQDYLNHQQMEYLLQTCLDQNHLFLRIGSKNDDSVFTRAFSSLVVALVLGKDRKERFLSEDTVKKTIESSMKYLLEEEDTRGYVEEKGWAHSIAHGADLLDEAIKHPLFDKTLASECLDTIRRCILIETAYVDEEDERLIAAIISLMEKEMNDDILKDWVSELSAEVTEIRASNGFSPTFFRKHTNLNQFLKALYFRLLFLERGTQTRKEIERILKANLLV
ncbi:DUF2785 domain-containing protein [Bacillus sp. ISL-35]|uniref:DUF2785 domain-containing protein n=1 Tax=Bacillus sp. ISL-35 TaxID=2819122 RepID=UPI001BE9735D|nr:DUF2785 domain-containing protein [Bacillus sp. ISL-35]MBT2681208.1 DUF2785 domain-containing protein [Bacillus sp. ISL-35]MBT2706119.1 DUF2785 domain-containing protein [Chryseobacterium sp. ISL-80]